MLLCILSPAGAKRTVGLFLNEEGSYDGYTIFSPIFYNVTYLIDNQGMLVNSWQSEYRPGWMAYLSEDGFLYRSIAAGTSSRFGDYGGGVEKLDWDGNVIWRYIYASDEYRQHHDICVLPSGNVLMIAWEHKKAIEAVLAGHDPGYLHPDGIWPDKIIEVEPVGDTDGKIVWEWHAWDHLVQTFDSTKENYEVLADHPELIDLNYPGYKAQSDWLHLNSVAYNVKLDQIVLSSREFSEIWVIDHSTTTAEARGHAGGRYGKGGDLLYRWGNPAAYGYGTVEDKYFQQQHDAHWIADSLPGAGNILVFNNTNFTVDELTPPVSTDGFYTGELPWGPQAPSWTYSLIETYLSYIISGAQRLPNGNTLICYGPSGTFSEVTPQGEEVWRYVNPVTDEGPIVQGDTMREPQKNWVFKVRRYPPDYPAFAGRDLTPKGTVELPGTGIPEEEPNVPVSLSASPAVLGDASTISYYIGSPSRVKISIYDALGRQVMTLVDETKPAGEYKIRWKGSDHHGLLVSPGVYFVAMQVADETITGKLIVIR